MKDEFRAFLLTAVYIFAICSLTYGSITFHVYVLIIGGGFLFSGLVATLLWVSEDLKKENRK